MSERIDVAAAILIKDEMVLIAQRAANDPLAGCWEFPGGKIEAGESPQECLIREMEEEFCIYVEVAEFFGSSTFDYEQKRVRLLAYYCKWISGDINAMIHAAYHWVTTEQLVNYEFAPADILLVEKLKEKLLSHLPLSN